MRMSFNMSCYFGLLQATVGKRFVNGIDEKAVNSIYVFFSLCAPVAMDVSYAQSHFLLSLF